MPDTEQVERRLLLAVDARGYGTVPGRLQKQVQNSLLEVLDEAARGAGLRRSEWDRQPGGDGELAVLPPDEPEPRVVERFPWKLRDALCSHNRYRRDGEPRLRLRLAVHFGEAAPGTNGYAGKGPVTVSRLCDIPPLKRALEVSGADLAVIFSRQIHDDTILQGYTHPLVPADLRKVRASVKELDEDAWIWIPGHELPALPEEKGIVPAPASASVPEPVQPLGDDPVFGGIVVRAAPLDSP